MIVNGAGDFIKFVALWVILMPVCYSQDVDRKSTRLNSSHLGISYAVFCLKKKNNKTR